jgi:CPA2 family monovalent cation:H+ antiporter-2
MLFASQNFLEDLGLVLCVAAFTTVLFQLIKQPVVVGYLIAGMVVGPHVPIPLFANYDRIHELSELGVILLMFALGLEFSLRKLVRLGPTAGFVCALQVGLMIWLGYVAGRAMGWTELEAIFVGAIIAISSSTIVAKALADEKGIATELRDLVFGVLLAEDLTAALMLAVLTALAAGKGLNADVIEYTVGRLGLFLAVLIAVGLLIVPWTIRRIVRLGRPETTLIAGIGICFAFSIAAERAGYSVALGAFLAGSLVAESGDAQSIEHLVAPVRDMFGAVFFVSVGMMINPALIVEHWAALAVLVAVVIGGKLVGVTTASMLSGSGVRTAVRAGMSLAQIGEFSFIIAGVGLQTHATRNFIYTLAVAVSAITTFSTPFMIRASGPAADFVARHLPENLLSLEAIYGSLMERMRQRGAPRTAIVRPGAVIVAAAVAICAILVLNERDPLDLTTAMSHLTRLDYFHAGLIVDLIAAAACVPFGAAMYLGAHRLSHGLARRAIPAYGEEDARGAVEALVGVLQATILLVVAMPMLAITQPFLEPLEGVSAVVITSVLIAIVIWRSGRKLQGQMAAVGRLIAASLSRSATTAAAQRPLEIPGVGIVTPVRLLPGSAAIGQTLAAINLRAATGASAVAITRDTDQVIVPTGEERLREGDVLELVGPSERIEQARRLLTEPSAAT